MLSTWHLECDYCSYYYYHLTLDPQGHQPLFPPRFILICSIVHHLKKLCKLFKPCSFIMLTLLTNFLKTLMDYYFFLGNSTANLSLCREVSGILNLSVVYLNNTTVILKYVLILWWLYFAFIFTISSCTLSVYTFSVSSTVLSSSTGPLTFGIPTPTLLTLWRFGIWYLIRGLMKFLNIIS